MKKEIVFGTEVTGVPVDEYRAQINYGHVYKTKDKSAEQIETSYWDAFTSTKLPTRLGATLAIQTDRFLRQFDEKDTMREIDSTFDPIKAFNEGGHTEDEMGVISQMDNWQQYYTYKEYKDWQDNSRATIAESGMAGKVLNFAGDVFTDPTIYAGYGAATMLSKGMAGYKALAIAGALGSATTEAVEQVADYSQERSAAESMIYIGAGATIGAALGAAGPLYNKIVNKAGKTYEKAAVDTVLAVDSIEMNTAKSLSAATVKKSPELSEIYGTLPRFLAKAQGVLAPVTRWQAAATDEARRAGAKFFGTTLATKENVAGVAQEASLMDYDSLLNRKVNAIKNELVSTARSLEKQGVKLDNNFFKRALVKINNLEDNLLDNTPESIWAKAELDAYAKIAKEAEGIDGFNLRQRYVATVYDEDAINLNWDALVNKMERFVKNEIASGSAQAKLAKLEFQLKSINTADDLDGALRAKIAGQANELRDFVNLSPDKLTEKAQAMAQMFKSGNFSEATLLFRDADKVMPSHFKERLLEQADMIDFMKVDPFERFAIYARDVVPHIASGKVFGATNPDDFIKQTVDNLMSKASKMPIGKDRSKLEMEAKKLESDLINGWNDLSGMTQVKARATLGEQTYHSLKAAKNFTSALMLGASIFANLAEFGATAITHGLSRQGALVKTMANMATSPALRNATRQEAKYLTNGMKAVTALRLSKEFSSEYIKSGMSRGVTDKIAKAGSVVNQVSQVTNLNLLWTKFYRDMVMVTDQSAFKESMELLVNGKLSGARATDLAKYGIDKYHAEEILALAKQYGEEVGGLFHFHTSKWPKSETKDIFETALLKSNRATSVDPRVGDVPHIAHVTGFDLIFQFKQWAITAGHTYALPSLQRVDADRMAGLAFYTGWSSLAYMFGEKAKGREPPTDMDEIIYAGVTNSGLLGIFPDYGGHYFMNRWFDLESGGAKYTEYSDWTKFFAPAAISVGNDLAGVSSPLFAAIDPNKEAEFNDKFWKDFVDILPIPLVKPYIKNQLLSE